jgi:hypothetical protein
MAGCSDDFVLMESHLLEHQKNINVQWHNLKEIWQ